MNEEFVHGMFEECGEVLSKRVGLGLGEVVDFYGFDCDKEAV